MELEKINSFWDTLKAFIPETETEVRTFVEQFRIAHKSPKESKAYLILIIGRIANNENQKWADDAWDYLDRMTNGI